MKKILTYIMLSAAGCAGAQVAIGKNSVTNGSVSLEFGADARGIILPYVANVTSLGSGVVPGTIVFDASSGIMRYLKDTGTWFDLTKNVTNFSYGGVNIADTAGKVNVDIQKNITDISTARTVIGTNPSADSAPGILVLSDTNKAMILPKMDSPHLNIYNPAPGMMAYDTKTNQLAVFNGTVWTFWRP